MRAVWEEGNTLKIEKGSEKEKREKAVSSTPASFVVFNGDRPGETEAEGGEEKM